MITSENVRAVIKDTVLGFDLDALRDDQRFRDAGIDSLDFINILFAIDERHGTHIPDEDVKLCNSVDAILAYVNRPAGASDAAPAAEAAAVAPASEPAHSA